MSTPVPPCLFLPTAPASRAISTLSLHDALPISPPSDHRWRSLTRTSSSASSTTRISSSTADDGDTSSNSRSEEHTSELQSPCNLVCRLLLEKKKTPTGRAADQSRRYRPRTSAPA